MCLIREVQDVRKRLLLPQGHHVGEDGRKGLRVPVLLLEVGEHDLIQGQCLHRRRIAVGRYWGLNVGMRVLRGQQRWMVQLATQSRVNHGSALRAE